MFCEKPISLDLATVDATLAAVDKAGTFLQVGFNRRFDPAHEAVRDRRRRRALGTLCLVRITSRDRLPPPVAYLARSGGMFLDMTIHDFDMARFVTGSDVVEVHAAVGAALVDPAIGEIGDIDTAVVVLRHASGCLTRDRQQPAGVYGYDQRVEALGTAGLAVSENPPRHTAVIAGERAIGGAVLADSFIDRYEDELRAAVAVVRRQRRVRRAARRERARCPRAARRRARRRRVDGDGPPGPPVAIARSECRTTPSGTRRGTRERFSTRVVLVGSPGRARSASAASARGIPTATSWGSISSASSPGSSIASASERARCSTSRRWQRAACCQRSCSRWTPRGDGRGGGGRGRGAAGGRRSRRSADGRAPNMMHRPNALAKALD